MVRRGESPLLYRLPNDNTLIAANRVSVIFEAKPAGAAVWRYVNPAVANGTIHQGDPIVTTRSGCLSFYKRWGNVISRSYRYAPDYPGLQYYDLMPKGTVELYRDAGQ